eukprot:CAMPEP_0196737252 /NCGR_PEP_ID=MMETSP1091-20130531/15054_1 /TAXON_ID=302021 /ORGANISM="Rhodomonas sp., Strain CCMP768" /LENGTH=86 /DNA_ID=CAMNT_0042081081 /DNA_START=61 /DNA_END=318 /DNA_ORIENTATION=+
MTIRLNPHKAASDPSEPESSRTRVLSKSLRCVSHLVILVGVSLSVEGAVELLQPRGVGLILLGQRRGVGHLEKLNKHGDEVVGGCE